MGKQRVESLIDWAQAHDRNILLQVWVILVDEFHSLVVDQRAIGVVGRAMAASKTLLVLRRRIIAIFDAALHNQLRCFLNRHIFEVVLPELSIRLDKIWDTLGGIEARDLDDVLAGWVVKLCHATAVTLNVVAVMFKAPRPGI